MGIKAQMQRLKDMRARCMAGIVELERKLERERLKLTVLDEALSSDDQSAARGKNTKRTVIEIAEEAAKRGVTVSEVIEKAKEKGKSLKPSSVSSLLSKLKSAGALSFDGERYYAAPSGSPELKVVKTA